MFCKKCGKPIGVDDKFCPHCGTPVTDDVASDIFTPMAGSGTLPMNWYKFLIYFSLFAGAIISILGVTSSVIIIIKDIGLYLANLPLFALEIAYAACNLAYAIVAICTRMALAGFKKKGPFMLYTCYGISAVSEIIYAVYSYMSGNGADVSIIITLLTAIAMIAANYIYFTKRGHLFVN